MLSCRMVLFMYAVSLDVYCETVRELIDGIRAESNGSDVAEPDWMYLVIHGGRGSCSEASATRFQASDVAAPMCGLT